MKYFFISVIAFTTFLTASCSSDTSTEEPVKQNGKTSENEPFEKRFKREIEASLQIPATEKYTYRVYKAFVNSDTIEDAIITVNRFDYAIDQAIKSKNTAKAAEMGYIGRYNYFFFYDGAADIISKPVNVPSSPGRELDVAFASITSPTRQDIVVDYRIRNSGWRCYYTATGEAQVSLIFQWKLFDHVGEDVPEALNHVLEASPEGITQDISIYQSTIDHYDKNIGDEYKYVPQISQKGALLYRFFYDPRVLKFRIYSDEMLKDLGLKAVGPRTR